MQAQLEAAFGALASSREMDRALDIISDLIHRLRQRRRENDEGETTDEEGGADGPELGAAAPIASAPAPLQSANAPTVPTHSAAAATMAYDDDDDDAEDDEQQSPVLQAKAATTIHVPQLAGSGSAMGRAGGGDAAATLAYDDEDATDADENVNRGTFQHATGTREEAQTMAFEDEEGEESPAPKGGAPETQAYDHADDSEATENEDGGHGDTREAGCVLRKGNEEAGAATKPVGGDKSADKFAKVPQVPEFLDGCSVSSPKTTAAVHNALDSTIGSAQSDVKVGSLSQSVVYGSSPTASLDLGSEARMAHGDLPCKAPTAAASKTHTSAEAHDQASHKVVARDEANVIDDSHQVGVGDDKRMSGGGTLQYDAAVVAGPDGGGLVESTMVYDADQDWGGGTDQDASGGGTASATLTYDTATLHNPADAGKQVNEQEGRQDVKARGGRTTKARGKAGRGELKGHSEEKEETEEKVQLAIGRRAATGRAQAPGTSGASTPVVAPVAASAYQARARKGSQNQGAAEADVSSPFAAQEISGEEAKPFAPCTPKATRPKRGRAGGEAVAKSNVADEACEIMNIPHDADPPAQKRQRGVRSLPNSTGADTATPARGKEVACTRSPSSRTGNCQGQGGTNEVLISKIGDPDKGKVSKKIVDLKGNVQEEPRLCTHLVTEYKGKKGDEIAYTAKMLAVVALGGRPVVTRGWVDESYKKGEWLPVDEYIVKDSHNPKFDFSGKRNGQGGAAGGRSKKVQKGAETCGGDSGIFEGLHFVRLENFEYPREDCKMVIEAAGGSLADHVSDATGSSIVLASQADVECVKKNKTRAASNEMQKKDFVKFSILNHKLDRKTFRWQRNP